MPVRCLKHPRAAECSEGFQDMMRELRSEKRRAFSAAGFAAILLCALLAFCLQGCAGSADFKIENTSSFDGSFSLLLRRFEYEKSDEVLENPLFEEEDAAGPDDPGASGASNSGAAGSGADDSGTTIKEPAYRIGVESMELSFGKEFSTEDDSDDNSLDGSISMVWTNYGTEPFPEDWPVCLCFLGPDGSILHQIRLPGFLPKLLPGETRETVSNFRMTVDGPTALSFLISLIKTGVEDTLSGETENEPAIRLAAGIINPETGLPSVQLASEMPYLDGWNILMSFPGLDFFGPVITAVVH